MNKFFSFVFAMSVPALMFLAGCGSSEKGSSQAPTSGGAHSMPDGAKMDGKDMKK